MQATPDRIDSNDPMPIGQQLRAILLKQIEDGTYAPRQRLPSERLLAERFGISRTSVREAMTHLLNLGVLYRTVGRGTFVAERRETNKTRAAGQIGFWIDSDIFNFVQAGYSQILTGAGEACRQRGCRLQFHAVGAGREALDAVLEEDLKTGGLDGSLVVGGLNRHALARLREVGAPLLLVDLLIAGGDAGAVRIDYRSGVRMAVEHLQSLGHRTIGFIGFPVSEKYEAYWQSLEACGLAYNPRHAILLSPAEPEPGMMAGYQGAQKLMGAADPPTALIVTNDHVAIGAMEALALAGVPVPGGMSVVGCDDLGLARLPLTTIQVDLAEVGRVAANALLDQVEKDVEPGETLVPVKLLIRGTTAPPFSAA